MPFAIDNSPGAMQWLSGVNGATNLGATNSTWSGNATVTLVCAAIQALAPVAGGSQDMKDKVCDSLRNGVNAGVASETHGVTTIAGAQALGTAAIPSLPASYTGYLYQ